MANKSVYPGIYTTKIKLKRILILFLLGIICLTFVEAQGRVRVREQKFEHLPAQNFLYFKGSDNILSLDFSGNVWISSDAGAEWNLVSGVPKNVAAALIKHTFSEDKAYILTIGETHYKTSDRGKSWQKFTTPIPPAKKVKVLSFHAHREDYLLFRGTKCSGWLCTDVTYYTTDGFNTSPKLLLENTDNCIWAHSSKKFDEAPEQSIFCIRYDVSGSGSMRKLNDYRLVESEDYFKDEESTKIVDFNSGGDVRGVIGLGESQEYLAAAVKDVNSFDMKMFVSVDGQRWARAFFPLKKEGPKENAYTILESPSNHLIVDLLSSESHNTGTLYLSNSNGTYFVDRLEHTNRNDKGVVDFKISQSVGGILFANIVSNYKEVDQGSAIAKKLQSKISFDDGVTWNFIKPPDKNLGGRDFQCMNRGKWEQGECSLHLHSVTSSRNNGHIFSNNEAPGVLMGVGNVGPFLLPYDQCDTFLSYDGGLTWKVIRLGAHMYGIGHYGTILVIVDDEQPTEEVLYSYDRGETWNSGLLGKKIVAKLLTTDSTSKNFLLLGSSAPNHDSPNDGGSYRHYIFKLDFSELFNRDCNRDDFDDWVVKRSESGSDCFMGKKTTYHRRKAEARCFVVSSQQPSPDIASCACTEKDFECDFNYILDEAKETCIPLLPERIPDGECKDKDTYEGSSGYRKIPENECDPDNPNSVRLDEPKTKKCSEGHSGPPLYGEVLHRTANFAVNNYFYFPESTTLMIQTTDGKVKRSTDEGSTWDDVLSEAGPIAFMFLHDHDKTKAYFFPDKADDKTYYMWFTTDSGNTFDKTELKNEPNKLNLKMLDFHPKEYDWLLFMAGTTCPGCHSITYFSSDNGKSWKEIETWADKCIFGKDTEFSETENDVVFCSSYKDKNSKISQDVLGGRTSEANPLQLIKMKTDGGSKKVLLDDIVNFFVFNEFMAVATEERGQLLLHISEDGSKFSNATFPPDINVDQQAYTILPSSTGSIFLDVYKSLRLGSEYGSLFKSNSDGTDFNRILDNTNRNVYGNVDFEKVQGLDGIILANQVLNVDELNEYVKKQIITKISYDDGSHWKRLKFNGGGSNCQDCYLNLHGRTDIRGPGSIFSAPSAIGLLIGVGNFGRHLLPYNECNTFMSRDGGRIWKEIRRGPSLYEFGDQGTIIVVVDNEAPTDHILYSWDYGENWKKYTFTTSAPVRASFLTTNANSTSMKFLLLGYTIQTSTHEASPVVVTLDFSQLEKKKCDKSDYELWNPMDENSDDHTCLLGEEVRYWRRRADAECHIGESIPKPPERKICKCTKHDFECAHGYWRNETGQCELMGPDPDRPANCKDKYKGHSGYIKMRKSKCEGGENLDKTIEKPCNSGNIISKTKVFNQRIIEYFYFNKSNTILARSMDNVVWRSTDEGYTWTSDIGVSEKIYGIIQNPHFNNYAYLLTLEETHFYTSDSGVSFKEFKAPMKPNLLQIPILNFHPDKPEYLIYIGSKDCEDVWSQSCHTNAFYTWNNGDSNKSWKSLDTYVRVCQWARNKKFIKVHPDLIICESYLNKEGSQKMFFNNPLKLVSSNDFFKNKKTGPFENIVGFTIYEEFMIVAELLPNGQSLRLQVSLNAEDFAEARFPPNMLMTQNAYTVLESATYSITLHVTTSSTNKYGNILKSNGNGTFYSFSLGYANRDDNGFVDFEKMQGIQGIALANIVGNVNEVNMGNDRKLKSMITTNDGATWKLLNRPEFDSNNNKYNCDGPLDKCSLHLHSYTERRNPRDSFSSSSAIGLMMGVGNVGEYLTPYLEGDTFLTRDAGATWIEVKKGAYMYEFGNQGGIIVLVDDEQATDHILYSLNEGLSWQEYKFIKVGEQPIRVFDIDTMPGGLSSKFILRGLIPSRGGEEVVVHLDFSSIFTRTCDLEKDFEKWTPKHQDNECLFGHKISYLRKIRENECFIDDSLRYKKERGENCDCTDHDFECDYNYMRNAEGECVLVPGALPLQRSVAEQCADSNDGFWYELSGYRKLKASTCGNPPPKYGRRHPCPGNHSVLFWIIIILSPFVIVGIVTLCFINRRYGRTGGNIRLGSSIEPDSIIDMLYQIRMPRFISRLWSKIPLPGRRNSYRYSPVATDDGHDVLMDDYAQDNETL